MTAAQPTANTQSTPRISPDWLIALALLIGVVALWLPFGWNVGFVGDDWFLFLNARFGSAWATLGRPLVPVPFVLGYALAPGQFVGFNLMLALLILARSGLCYAILRRLGVGRGLAFGAAALVLVFPADTGLFYLGALNVYFSWIAFLLAFYCLLLYWRRPRVTFLAVLWLAQVLCLGTYEAAYPLILVAPLALLPERRSRSRWRGTLIRWYLFPALNLIRLALVALLSPAALDYQSGLVTGGVPSISSMIESVVGVYVRHFWGGWVDGGISSPYLLIGAALGVLVAAVAWWLARRDPPAPSRVERWLPLAGLAIVGLGVLIYVPTSLRDDTLRTYFGSSAGAALAISALVWLLIRRALPFAVIIGLLAALGCGHLLEQHAVFVRATEAQQTVIVGLAAVAPSIAPGSTLIVMDESPGRDLSHIFPGRWQFQMPFLLVYDDPTLTVALCYPDDAPQNPDAYCAFEDQYIEARLTPAISWQRLYSTVIFLRYTGVGEFVVADTLAPYGDSPDYNPDALIDRDSPPPALIRSLFTVQAQP